MPKGYFHSVADHTLPTRSESVGQKLAQSPLNAITQLMEIKEEGRSPTMDRQWLRGIKFKEQVFLFKS